MSVPAFSLLARVALAAALLLGALGCSEPRPATLPQGEEVAAPFPGAGFALEAAPNPPLPPRLVEVTPQGYLAGADTLTFLFDQPMMQVDGASLPVTITPPLKGAWAWQSPHTLTFSPAEPLPQATAFTVQLPTTLKSLSGQPLAAEITHRFATPPLLLMRPRAGDWDDLPPDHRLSLEFNLPVERAQLREHLRLVERLAGADLPMPFELIAAEAAPDGAPPQDGSAFLLYPRDGFKRGASYQVTLDAGLKSPAGPLGLQQPWSADLHIKDPLRVHIVDCEERCLASSYWRVQFNSRVDTRALTSCFSTHPKLALHVQDADDTLDVWLKPIAPRPGTTYTLTMTPGCVDRWGSALAEPLSTPIQIHHQSAHVGLTGREGMTSLEPPASASEPLQLPVTLRNVKDVRVKMMRVTPDNLAALLRGFRSPQRGLEEPVFQKLSPQVDRLVMKRLRLDDADTTYGVNLREVLGAQGRGVAYVAVQGNPAFVDEDAGDTDDPLATWAIVQVTDIGLAVKDSPGSSLIWTTHLSTGAPQPGVRVSLHTPDGERLWEGVTDDAGLARGPGAFVSGGAGPRLLIAQRGDDVSYMLISRINQLDINKVKESQGAGAASPAKVRGLLFTERGVFHPGEEAHIQGYLRLERGSGLEALPRADVTVTVTDPHNSVLQTSVVRLSPLGSLEVTVPLPAQAPLGTYAISARPAAASGEPLEPAVAGSFRVEAPDTLATEVLVTSTQLPESPGGLSSWEIATRRRSGGAPSGAQVKWRLTATPADLHPAGLSGFAVGVRPDGEPRGDEATQLESGSAALDGSGALKVTARPPGAAAPSHPLRLTLEAEVNTQRGPQGAGRGERVWYPAGVYVGLRPPGELVKAGEPLLLDVVAIQPDGALVAGQRVEVALKRREWRNEPAEEVEGRCAVTTGAAPVTCALEIKRPGDYIVEGTTRDSQGRASRTTTRLYAWGDGECGWEPRDDERVSLVMDKSSYRVGDTARVLIQSPSPEAHALVTVERRGVLQRWVRPLRGAAATVEIPITEDLSPGAYVSVVLSRGSGEPRQRVGYAELNVSQDAKRLQVSVEPAQLAYRPGEEVLVKLGLKDAGGAPVAGEITFMAVDDAGLSLMGYTTPDPLDALYRPEPLEVNTSGSDLRKVHNNSFIFDDKSSKELARGGGVATSYQPAYATTAALMPRVEVGADGVAQVRFKLPDNLTALRLMAVGGAAGDRFGSGEARVKVRKPLSVRPTLPRFLSSGDTLALRAIVQNAAEQPIQAKVNLQVEGPVTLNGAASLTVDLAPGASQEVAFPASVTAPGEVLLRWSAAGRGESAAAELSLPVRASTPLLAWSEHGVVQAGDDTPGQLSRRLALPPGVHPELGGLDITLTSAAMGELLPSLNAPHDAPDGSAEQTADRLLPQLVLSELLDPAGPQEIQAGLDHLWTLQRDQGGLASSPGDAAPDPWASAYGALPLVLASRSDPRRVDQARLHRLLEHLHALLERPLQAADRRGVNPDLARPMAAYALALAGRLKPHQINNLFAQRARYARPGRALLALAFIEAGAEADRFQRLLIDLWHEVEEDGASARLPGESPGSSDVQASALFLQALLKAGPSSPLVPRLADGLREARRGGRWGSPRERAFAVMALGAWLAHAERDEPSFQARVFLDDDEVLSSSFPRRRSTPLTVHIPMKRLLQHPGGLLTFLRDGERGPLSYTLTLRYAEAHAAPQDAGFTLLRDLDPISSPVGDRVQLSLTVIASTLSHNVAIHVPLPAGLEVEELYLYDMINTYISCNFNYLCKDVELEGDQVSVSSRTIRSGVYHLVIVARAATPGTFALPPARVEAGAPYGAYGRSASGSLTID